MRSRRFSRNVDILGQVSFLNTVSIEMTLTLLPLFLASVTGVRTAAIGFVEGLAETAASLTKLYAGWLSDADARGLSFGFHRALDTAGAVVGLALGALVLYGTQRGTVLLSRETFQRLVLLAAVPGFAAVLLPALGGPAGLVGGILRQGIGPWPGFRTHHGLTRHRSAHPFGRHRKGM